MPNFTNGVPLESRVLYLARAGVGPASRRASAVNEPRRRGFREEDGYIYAGRKLSPKEWWGTAAGIMPQDVLADINFVMAGAKTPEDVAERSQVIGRLRQTGRIARRLDRVGFFADWTLTGSGLVVQRPHFSLGVVAELMRVGRENRMWFSPDGSQGFRWRPDETCAAAPAYTRNLTQIFSMVDALRVYRIYADLLTIDELRNNVISLCGNPERGNPAPSFELVTDGRENFIVARVAAEIVTSQTYPDGIAWKVTEECRLVTSGAINTYKDDPANPLVTFRLKRVLS
jgi:hypothetical protein